VDRDESTPKLRIDVMAQLAERIGSHGFGSLRYDKRGVGASEGEYFDAGFYDNGSDAEAALGWLRSQDGVDPARVFVLGHSEGALHAARLAARGDVAGAVLIAGTAMSGEDCMRWQAAQIVAGMGGVGRWLIDVLRLDVRKMQQKAMEKIKRSDKNTIRVQVVTKLNAKWFREFLAYDPARDLSRITVPVLAITGAKDIQVCPDDLEIMARRVQGEIECHKVPDLTHLLRADPGEPSLSSYRALLKQPVDERVLRLVSDWLVRKAAKPDPVHRDPSAS
jgi:pimeloyl-ACP methyl ester carboxylesterase